MQINQLSYGSFASVTKSDGNPVTCRAIYVGGAGDVTVSSGLSSAAVTFKAVPVGTILPIMLDQGRIMSTDTTATLLLILQ